MRNTLTVATPTPTTAPTPEENKTRDEPSTFERIIRWYTRAPLYFSGGLVGLICFVLMQTFGKIEADRKAPAAERPRAESTAEFPSELDVEDRAPVRSGKFTKKKESAKGHAPFDSEGLKRLRDALRDISFRLPGLSFKAQVRGDAVWIYMVKANQGTQETIASAKAKLSILTDAMTMPRDAFRERLEKFLRENGFEI